MMADPGPDHLSQLSLDLLRLGGLGDNDSHRARQHIDTCRECRERFDTLRRETEDFERNVYPRTVAEVSRSLGANPAKTSKETSKEASKPSRSLWWAPVVAVAAAGVAVVLFYHPPERPDDSRSGVLEKGAPTLTVFVQHAGRVFVLPDGARLEPRDALRFTAEPAGYPYLLIASIDSAHRATVYFPYHGERSARIEGNRRFEDNSGIALDQSLGPERIFALFSHRPVEAVDVTRALLEIGSRGPDEIRRVKRLAVSADFQTSIHIEK